MMQSCLFCPPHRIVVGPWRFLLVALMLLQWVLAPVAVLAETTAGNAPLKGGIVVSEDGPTEDTALGPKVQLETGEVLDMKIATMIQSGLSTEGDEFFGKISHDYTVGGQLVLPRGTLVHGTVEQITDAKWAGRDGFINMKLDYLVTPDGREIPIEAASTTRDSKGKAILKTVGRTAGYTAVGGVAGAVMALRYGGILAATASNGYIIAGAAAAGGAIGLAAALGSKGQSPHIPEGTELRIKLAAPIQVATMVRPDPAMQDQLLPGLSVVVKGVRVDKDPFGEAKELTLTLDLSNQTSNAFGLFDMALVDEYGVAHYPSPFGDTGLWFQRLAPNSRLTGNLSFSVDDATLQHYLVFYQQYTRAPLAKIAVNPPPPTELSESKATRKKARSKKATSGS